MSGVSRYPIEVDDAIEALSVRAKALTAWRIFSPAAL